MLDQDRINYKKVDLDQINSNQPLKCKNKEKKRFDFKFFYNIFNKAFKITFEMRF